MSADNDATLTWYSEGNPLGKFTGTTVQIRDLMREQAESLQARWTLEGFQGFEMKCSLSYKVDSTIHHVAYYTPPSQTLGEF